MAHHFFVSPSDVRDGIVELTGEEAHHAARVLRLRTGEAISVADGTGRVVDAVVTRVGSVVTAEVRGISEASAPQPSVTLYQGVAKGERMDDMVEKAVEIGISCIVPFMAERTLMRWNAPKRMKASQRWTAIAKAAAKQSRSPWLTRVAPVGEGVASAAAAGGLKLVLHEQAQTRLRDVLAPTPPDTLALVVGPEGGLTPGEVETLGAAGASVVSLGERILRTETAGIVAAAIIGYVYGSLG